MNFQQLETYCKVVSEGSMTAAAEKLFLTQPAVSQQIRNLEDEIGTNLLVRGVRNVKPTLQGQLLYDYAKKILQLADQAEVALKAMSNELSGDVKIGTLNSLGLYLISPVIGMFLKHNTNLRISLNYGNSMQLIEDMKNDLVDIMIMPEPEIEFASHFEKFNKKYLMTDEMWLVGSGRDLNLPQSITMKDYNQFPIVQFTNKYISFQKQINEKIEAEKLVIDPVFQSDNVGTLKRVIETGIGWGFLPSHSIKKQVRAGRLSRIQVEDLNFTTTVNLYYKKTKEVESIVEVLYRAIRQQGLN